jgi:hypothetical protein
MSKMTLKEIEAFVNSYEDDIAQGGDPLMSEKVYIKHVKWLIAVHRKMEGNVMTEITPEEMPNLQAILDGRVSGRVTEWPAVKTELVKLLTSHRKGEERVGELENKVLGLEMSMPKDPKHPDCIIVLKSGFDAYLSLSRERAEQAEASLKLFQQEHVDAVNALPSDWKANETIADAIRRLSVEKE